MIIKKLASTVYQIGGFFSYAELVSINDEFCGYTNSMGIKRDEYDNNIPPQLCLNKPSVGGVGDNMTLLSQSPKIKLLIKKIIQPSFDITLTRINTNIQFAGQESTFHTDGGPDWCWSAVLCSSLNWNTQWGGEFVCLSNEGEYVYAPYIPGNLIIFDSTQDHRGTCPNFSTKQFRTSVAWTYSEYK